MNSKKWIAIAGGLVAIFILTTGISFFTARHLSSMKMAAKAPGLLAHSWDRELNLTSEQKKKLDPLNASLEKDLSAIQTKLAGERVALCSVMMNDTGADQKGLDQYIQRVSTLEGEQQRRVVQHLLAMKAVLTPDQKQKFFTAIMQDICTGCRLMTHSDKDICAMCNIKKG